MKFVAVKCDRSVAIQRIIWARLAAYEELDKAAQSEIRALIADIADTSEEGRALFDVLVRAGRRRRSARGQRWSSGGCMRCGGSFTKEREEKKGKASTCAPL